jgi:uncharacterized protein YyaL (SSP411 family)
VSTDHPPSAGDDSVPAHSNRLIHESSPYLLQHAHNPVDWYPWGPEAFARAKAEDKPVLLSVGYAACHWCHVMERESFENPETARLMNEYFVSIKVDREERPDVDALYMDAVQALTGGGGWPMTVFLTPDAVPFYGGTYFPPDERYNMPGFPRLLRTLGELWRTRRDEIEHQADEFRRFYARRGAVTVTLPAELTPTRDDLDPAVLTRAAEKLASQIDETYGGFGRAPKFPHAPGLELLLRVASRTPTTATPDDGSRPLALVRLTLDRMAEGGIYDQVGGGFHRYATDQRWIVPHFEKMLYDNALLAPVYLHAWQLTGEARYRRICEETLDYVLREMTDASGGFYSTQDADSEGHEGRFYVWTPNELSDALGAADARILGDLWGVTERGNFEGRTILHVAQPEAAVAARHGLTEPVLRERIARGRQTLYAARSRRVWPGRDDKVLAAWNGLMQRALAEAGRVLDREDYRAAARRNAGFLRERMMVDGRLKRSWRNGEARIHAFLEDYAAIANGLLTTYEATGDASLFAWARELTDQLLARFWDAEIGVFYDTAHDHETLIGRPRELADGATPSGTSLAVEALLRLAALTGAGSYREIALRTLGSLLSDLVEHPSAFSHLLNTLDDALGPFYEVALIGDAGSPDLERLQQALAGRFLPRMVLAQAAPNDADAAATVPLLAGRTAIEGRATAYVCQDFVCRQPVTEPASLLELLNRSSRRAP